MIGQSHGSVLVPDGVYEGTCTGNKVTFSRDNHSYQFELMKVTAASETPVKIVVKGMKANVYET